MLDELSIEALDREWDQLQNNFGLDSQGRVESCPLFSKGDQIVLG
jgi:hypothetical protein